MKKLRLLSQAGLVTALAGFALLPAPASAQNEQAADQAAQAAGSQQTEQNHILTTEQEHEAAQKRAKEVAAKRAAALKAAISAPTPMMADGHPDLSGVWGTGGGITVHTDAEGTIHVTFPAREAPKSVDPDGKLVEYYLQVDGDRNRANNPNKPPYKEEVMAKVRELDKGENQMDPVVSCHPTGVPRAFPRQIMSVPGYVVMWYTGENSGHYRLIPINGGKHPDGAYDTYWGDSVAHWDGDTLVIDVTNFNDRTWLGSDGWFHSTAMHVTERLRREGNALHYQATVEDPNVFTKPWMENARTVLLNTDANNYVFEDLPCKDFDQNHFVNHDHF